MASEWARRKASSVWCTKKTENIQFDPKLAEAFATVLDEVLEDLGVAERATEDHQGS